MAPEADSARWYTGRRMRSWLFLSLVLACTGEPEPRVGPPEPAAGNDRTQRTTTPAPPRVEVSPPESTYALPPEEVVAIIDAPATPQSYVSPDRKRLMLAHYDHLPSIATLARPFARLAGIRIDEKHYAERRTKLYEKIEVLDIGTGAAMTVATAPQAQFDPPQWSLDGSTIAWLQWDPDGLRLWVADPDSGEARQVSDRRFNTTIGPGFVFVPGTDEVIAWLVPDDWPAPPAKPETPSGPSIQDTAGAKAPNRTYQDLLQTPFDEALFEHLSTVQLARISLTDGSVHPLGEPGMYTEAEPSPDGKNLLVSRIKRPFSYAVPYYRFPRVVEVWDGAAAKVLRTVVDQPAAEEIPIGGVRTGPRAIEWHDQQPATLVWIEALDDGDPKKKVDHRDRLMQHAQPFADVPQMIARTRHRLMELDWTSVEGKALVGEYDRDRRWTTTWVYDFAANTPERKLIDRSIGDEYGDPGDPVYEQRVDGTVVVPVVDGKIFMAGAGASPEGERPFLAKLSLLDGSSERVFEAEEGTHEEFIDFALDRSHASFLVWHESPRESPNYFVVTGGTKRQLTRFPDPHPQLTGIDKRILKYKRKDGVDLAGTLYLPPGYEKGTKLPLVVWAYPREYNDKDTAGQVRAAPNRFTRLEGTTPLMFLTQGYAVLMGASMPVVGDPETMNDTFVDQIVWAAEAAIDAAVEEGVADRNRVGIGGHSYGAFMTANILAHSDLFKAGIANSGAYNRTLTPFGYQSERRTLWEAPETYVAVSPLFAADGLEEPVLFVHGAIDDNDGTYPEQSIGMFRALQGNGGTARLVVLPEESHGYAARESVLHVQAEAIAWFDKHVKNPQQRKK
jgi:dipeptidyl aminopeptidase/acylaminoacyl peptidase